MKLSSFALFFFYATSAFAGNKFSFVNSRYIDENTSWKTVLRTNGYVVKSPVKYIVEGRQIDAMQTCRRGANVYGWLTDPVWGSSQAGLVGVTWRQVEIPSSFQRPSCAVGRGSQAGCEPSYVTIEQPIHMSFPVNVLAVYNYCGGMPREFWGVAFKKNFEVPDCQ